jgi:hypothetical protein
MRTSETDHVIQRLLSGDTGAVSRTSGSREKHLTSGLQLASALKLVGSEMFDGHGAELLLYAVVVFPQGKQVMPTGPVFSRL